MDMLWHYIQKGILHVLDIKDYYHILFLVVLTVPFLFDKWKRSFLLISLIVISHTVTSILRLYDIARVDRDLLGFLMLATIMALAVYNIFTSGKRAQSERYGLAFFASLAFGILHGLDFVRPFNTVFKSRDNKLLALLEMALGIEIGFIILAFISMFMGFICQIVFRFTRRDWVMVISAIVVGIILPVLFSQGNLI